MNILSVFEMSALIAATIKAAEKQPWVRTYDVVYQWLKPLSPPVPFEQPTK